MIKINPLPDAERLRELLDYSLITGYFYWKQSRGTKVKGSMAGRLNSHGRRQIRIDGAVYCANRLAWLWVTGEDPGESLEVDHKDCDHSNDAWHNLRLATRKDNNRNRQRKGSCLKGVTKHSGKYKATIHSIDSPRRYLGLFNTEEEAHAAYCDAASTIYGEFARTLVQ